MRKLLPLSSLLASLSIGCSSTSPTGAGSVTITETTTSTTTTTTTTSTVPLPTVAAFSFSPVTPEVGQSVFFNASASTPGTGRTINAYHWDFGDGDDAKGVTATHKYSPSGIYLVTLTVTDDVGKDVSSAQPVTVRPVAP